MFGVLFRTGFQEADFVSTLISIPVELIFRISPNPNKIVVPREPASAPVSVPWLLETPFPPAVGVPSLSTPHLYPTPPPPSLFFASVGCFLSAPGAKALYYIFNAVCNCSAHSTCREQMTLQCLACGDLDGPSANVALNRFLSSALTGSVSHD